MSEAGRVPLPARGLLDPLVDLFDEVVLGPLPAPAADSSIAQELAEPLATDAARRWLIISLDDGRRSATVLRVTAPDLLEASRQLAGQVRRLRRQGQAFVGYKLDLGARLFPRPGMAIDASATMERTLFGLGLAEAEPSATFTLLPEEILTWTLINSKGRLRLDRLLDMTQWTAEQRQQLEQYLSQPQIDLFHVDFRSIYSDGTDRWKLYRGHRRFSGETFEDIRPEVLLEASRLGGNYLRGSLDASGKYNYSYLPKTDQNKRGYNILRHAGTTYSLFELYEATGDPSYLEAGERALGYLRRQIRDCAIDAALACVVEGGEVKLGGNGLAMLAFEKHMEVTGKTDDRELLERLGGYLLAEQAPSGEFLVHKRKHPSGTATSFVSGYYPGEALLALVRHPEGDPTWLDAAARGARWLINVRDKGKGINQLAHDHWLLYALNEIDEHMPEDVFIDHGARIAQAITSGQNRRPAYPDWYGSFYIPPRSTPTATRAEGLSAAYTMLRRGGRHEEAEAALLTMRHAVRFQLGTQFDAVSSLYLPNRPRALGGFRRALDNFEIRIDYVQHNISALLALRRLTGGDDLPATAAASAVDKGPKKLMVVSWDGTPDWVIDRLLTEGHLPNLQFMANRGVRAAHSVTSFPSKTAVGHASLWTGCWPGTHGVTGNQVLEAGPKPSLAVQRRGFSSEVMTAEPLFLTAALAGRQVTVLSATHSVPAQKYLDALTDAGIGHDRLRIFSGFETTIDRGRMLRGKDLVAEAEGWDATPEHRGVRREIAFHVGDSPFFALAYDSGESSSPGFDRVLIRQGSRSRRASRGQHILRPLEANQSVDGWSLPFAVRRGELFGHTMFRLFELSADGSQLALYQWKPSALEGHHTPQDLAAYQGAYPVFHDQAFHLYARGVFGDPRMAGGDGTAEQRLLELVRLDTHWLIQGVRFAVDTWHPDVLFHYSPMSDDAGHTWMGLLAPTSEAYDERLAGQLWPVYAEVFSILDEWLGAMLQLADDDTVVALVTDHGMTGTGREIGLHRILADAGLVTYDEDGRLDWARSKISAPDSPFFLRLHDQRYREGSVTTDQAPDILRRAEKALMAARDPQTGAPLFQRVLRPQDIPEAGVECDTCGDLFLDPAPGYYPRNGTTNYIARSARSPWGHGTHGFWPHRRNMQAIFYVTGPGVRRGHETAPIRHIDIAPTLAHLTDLPEPANVCGQIIEAALTTPL